MQLNADLKLSRCRLERDDGESDDLPLDILRFPEDSGFIVRNRSADATITLAFDVGGGKEFSVRIKPGGSFRNG